MKHFIVVFITLFLLICGRDFFFAEESIHKLQKKTFQKGPWIFNLSEEILPEDFSRFSLSVLEITETPVLEKISDKKTIALAYLNLGEIEGKPPYTRPAKERKSILENRSKNARGFLDVRTPEWYALVIETVIPNILFKRFDGVFIDNLEKPLSQEKAGEKGISEALIRMIKAMHHQYPEMVIMVNGAYLILREIASEIDMVLSEGSFSLGEKEREERMRELEELKREFPHLEVMALDYLNPSDKNKSDSIYKYYTDKGFYPYIVNKTPLKR